MVALPCSSPTTVSFAASRGAIPASNGLQVSSTSITSTLLINATQPPNASLLILRCPCSRGRIDTAWLIGVQAWRSADDGSAGGACYADPTFCAFAQWGPYAYESRLGNCQFRHEFLDQADTSLIYAGCPSLRLRVTSSNATAIPAQWRPCRRAQTRTPDCPS